MEVFLPECQAKCLIYISIYFSFVSGMANALMLADRQKNGFEGGFLKLGRSSHRFD